LVYKLSREEFNKESISLRRDEIDGQDWIWVAPTSAPYGLAACSPVRLPDASPWKAIGEGKGGGGEK